MPLEIVAPVLPSPNILEQIVEVQRILQHEEHTTYQTALGETTTFVHSLYHIRWSISMTSIGVCSAVFIHCGSSIAMASIRRPCVACSRSAAHRCYKYSRVDWHRIKPWYNATFTVYRWRDIG